VKQKLQGLITGIGGEPRLFELLEKFYQAISDDILIGFFFAGKDLKHIAKMQGEFILNSAGLSKGYAGKGPSTAHSALPPILSGHFDRRLVLLREVLTQEGLTSDQIDTWLHFEESFRKIITKD